MDSNTIKTRLAKGGTLVVVVITSLVLVIIGVLAVVLIKMFGGGQEAQNAVDNGALDAAKTALIKPGYTPTSGDASYSDILTFVGCAPSSGNFNGFFPGGTDNSNGLPPFALGDINRVWGQALIASINQKAMEAEGSVAPTAATGVSDLADTHATAIVTAAQAINNKVAQALQPDGSQMPPIALQNTFTQTANNNTMHMVSLNTSQQMTVDAGAQIGYQNAGQSSNVAVYPSQFDNVATGPGLTINTASILASLGSTITTPYLGNNYLNGYMDLAVNPNTGGTGSLTTKHIYFVPLQPDAKPHMLSGMEFNTTAPPLTTVTANPVNNAFLTKGKITEEKSNKLLDFAAIALAEPVNYKFGLSVPHGFIKIENVKGFSIDGTVLGNAGSDTSINNWPVSQTMYTGSSAGVQNTVNRGLHAAEYANHQLLESRSQYTGMFASGTDPYATSDPPLYGILRNAATGAALTDTNGAIIYVSSGDASGSPPYSWVPTTGAGAASSDCGGEHFMGAGGEGPTALPAGFQCSDLNNPAKITFDMAHDDPGADGSGNPYDTYNNGSEDGDIIAHNFNVQEFNGNSNGDAAFGNSQHPHIWSIDPQDVNFVINNGATAVATLGEPPAWVSGSANSPGTYPNYTTTKPSGWPWPHDDVWMYGGQQLLSHNDPAITNNVSRQAVTTIDPIAFGKAGTLWDYLNDQDPWSGAGHAQVTVANRILQRILEIKPNFNATPVSADTTGMLTGNSDLQTLLSSQPLDMGEDAYIFLDDSNANLSPDLMPMTMKVVVHRFTTNGTGSTVPLTTDAGGTDQLANYPWLKYQLGILTQNANYLTSGYSNHANYNLDIRDCLDGFGVQGQTMTYGTEQDSGGFAGRDITSEPDPTNPPMYINPSEQFLENVAGDWGFPTPFENADNPDGANMNSIITLNKYNFCPSVGWQGQLGVLYLENFIYHGSANICGGIAVTPPAGADPTMPEETGTCYVFPPGQFPAVGGTCTTNTPVGWPGTLGTGDAVPGTGNTAQGLPNCTHTGPC